MSAITKERIELFIKNPLDNVLTRGEQMKLARIALASFEAEAIAVRARWKDEGSGHGDWKYYNIAHRDALMADDTRECELVYTAPPVPVSVPDEMPEPDTARMFFTDAVVAISKVQGWNACCAAMLKSFGNSEQLDEVGSWNNHRNTPTAQDGNHTEQNLDMVDHFGDATQKAMLQRSEPETDNTNQQFESLSRGDK